MHPAIRTQAKPNQQELSKATELNCDPTQDQTRQEHAHDLDINVILRRHGAAGLYRRQPIHGADIDFDMDRQQALEALNPAKAFHAKLPPELRELYPTYREMLADMESGQFDEYKKELDKQKTEAKLRDQPTPEGRHDDARHGEETRIRVHDEENPRRDAAGNVLHEDRPPADGRGRKGDPAPRSR